jgi:hypothetical protein
MWAWEPAAGGLCCRRRSASARCYFCPPLYGDNRCSPVILHRPPTTPAYRKVRWGETKLVSL